MSTPDPYDDAANIFKSARAAVGLECSNETLRDIVLATLQALQDGYLQRMADRMMDDYKTASPGSRRETYTFANYESYLHTGNRLRNIQENITEEYK
jgi:hypothetical protein